MSSNQRRKRRSFTEEFKPDTVNRVVVEGCSILAAAKAVNVLPRSLREWHRNYAPEPEPCGEHASVEELKVENKRLRKTASRTASRSRDRARDRIPLRDLPEQHRFF